MRNESPRRPVLKWTKAQNLGLLFVCCAVAFFSSWHLLGEPDLSPGIIAPFDSIAPKDALVQDKQAIKIRRTDLISRTFVQVIDEKESILLKQNLDSKLQELELVANSNDASRIGPINLLPNEQVWLTKQSESEIKKWQNNIRNAAERMLSQGIINTLAINQIQDASSSQLAHLYKKNNPERTIGSKLLTNIFHGNSNLRTDPDLSQRLIDELITKQAVPTIKVKKGDLITRQGEAISPQAFDVLDHFGMVSRSPRPIAWLSESIKILASCAVLLLIMRRERPCLQARHGLLAIGLLLITQASKAWIGISIAPLAIIVPPTLLISQGFGTSSALAWMAIASFIWPIPFNGINEGRMMIACIAAAVAAIQGARIRSRSDLLQMAIFLPFLALIVEWILLRGNTNNQLNLFSNGITPKANDLVSEALITAAMLMITILLIPLLESTFGLITRARLLELADQERPLLRRLSKEAPGTFEHTLMICSLAEEGARAIGADVDLIRTGALYHDVGKLHAPEWFIENQTIGKKNPHEQLNDPLASVNILQAHVDEGLKLARKYRLPRPVADFIPEHQGTLKMGYFFHKARELNPSIPEKLFRYLGPVPRSRETAILMLADGCEAALRALDPDTDNHDAQSIVRKIVESRQIDGQLKESSLSRSEVELVIRAFVRVWRRMRHQRIPYPVNIRKNFSS